MWKKIAFLTILSVFWQNTQAFHDISSNSKFGEKVSYLIEQNILEDGYQLRPLSETPQLLFWKTILSLQEKQLVSNQQTQQFLEQKHLPKKSLFNSIDKHSALKIVLNQVPNIDHQTPNNATKALRIGVFQPLDFQKFNASKILTRKEFLTWIYNLKTNKYKIKNRKQKHKKTTPPTKTKTPSTSLEKVYRDILRLANKHHTLTDEKKLKIYNAAIEAMFKEVGDEYGLYFSPTENKVYEEKLDDEFVGIGVYVQATPQGILIKDFLPHSPAKASGLKVGDILTKVDTLKYSEKEKNEFLQNIRGKENTTVQLEFWRNKQKKQLTVVRKKIIIPSAEIEFIQHKPVIKITNFSKHLPEEVLEIFKKHKTKLQQGFIIDLRNNSGGYLNSAARLSSAFAQKDELMFLTNYQNRNIRYRADEDGALSDYKDIIVLQNKVTASSAEIFASFLQQTKRAKIYGQSSRGKGTIQQIKTYPNGASVKVTIGDWRPVNGQSINRIGLTPDKKFPFRTQEQINQNIDPVLNAALSDL
ncbi:hypothetical protein CSB37_01740 [bacterium DOLZORAL124_38_8]|nr:MAG: hypothetical protein CSB37_01740 [bacterium DOLZORAL124_38_8]